MNRSRLPILVCDDGSPGAAHALETAATLFPGTAQARPLSVEAAPHAADAIERVATQESALAVVVGRRNRTRLGALLLGSVPQSVVDDCPMPVVVV